MNQTRNILNSEREDSYQNVGRNRPNFGQNLHPHLNSNYQLLTNYLDWMQNDQHLRRAFDRDRRQQEPEENIYERLDEVNSEYNFTRAHFPGSRNGNVYERIDDRMWMRYRSSRAGNLGHVQNLPGPSHSNNYETNRNFGYHEAPRHVYLESRRLSCSQSCLTRLGRLGHLGRNCFSTENITYASNRRYIYQIGHSCTCQFCRQLDFRYACHYCHHFHDRSRYHENGNARTLCNSRHYIYQLSRSCRCAYCRGESIYARFPVNSRLPDSIPRDCHCRSPGNCACRNRFLSYSNPAIYMSRMDRGGWNQSFNNALYANPAIYVGRIDRSCASGLNNLASGMNPTNPIEPVASASVGPNEPIPCSSQSSSNHCGNPSNLNIPACPMARISERQHVCDDSCIRNPNRNQFARRCEKADCQHGKGTGGKWVVHNNFTPDRNPERDDDPRDRPESDSDES